jgi:ketosteroid isomerase-like protein
MFKRHARESTRAAPDENVERLRAMYHALGPGFPAEALLLFDQESESDRAGWCLRQNGHVLRWLSAGELANDDLFSMPGSWEVMRVVVHSVMPKRDIVTVTGAVYCRPRGSWETMRLPLLHIWTMRAGKALRFENYLDGLELSRVDGLVSRAR